MPYKNKPQKLDNLRLKAAMSCIYGSFGNITALLAATPPAINQTMNLPRLFSVQKLTHWQPASAVTFPILLLSPAATILNSRCHYYQRQSHIQVYTSHPAYLSMRCCTLSSLPFVATQRREAANGDKAPRTHNVFAAQRCMPFSTHHKKKGIHA